MHEELLDVHYIAGGVYAKQMHFQKAGDTGIQHKHNFDHLSLLVKGKVVVSVEGEATVYTAPAGINVKAGKEHTVMALEDDSLWYCIHAIPSDLQDEASIETAIIAK